MSLDLRSDEQQTRDRDAVRADTLALLSDLRGGGLPNGVAAVEQLSYLLLALYLYLEGRDEHAWTALVNAHGEERFEVMQRNVLPELVTCRAIGQFSSALRGAVFAFPSAALFDLAVSRLKALRPHLFLCADLLDIALDEISATGQLASPRTPAVVARTMLALTRPEPSERVVDPAAGTADRLLALSRYDPGPFFPEADGVEVDATMARLGALSLLFHGVDDGITITHENALAHEALRTYDVVLCQPPFGLKIDSSLIAPERGRFAGSRSEILFADFALRSLETTGRAAIVLPSNVAFSGGAAASALRRELVERGLRVVIALPGGTFRPHTNVETFLVVVDRRSSNVVAFVDARERDDGLASEPVLSGAAEIVEFLLDGREPDRDALRATAALRAFVVDHDEMRRHDYALLPRVYRPEHERRLSLESPEALLGRIQSAEDEITAHVAELRMRLDARNRTRG